MKLTHLGHESWIIELNGKNYLLDPLLRETFGTCDELPFYVTPGRSIEHKLYESIDGVFLTTEYFQHFDLKSLELLPKRVNYFFPNTFSKEAQKALCRIAGCEKRLKALRIAEEFKSESMGLKFVPPSSDTVFWDSRVCSLMVSESNGLTDSQDWIYIQSDTAIPDSILEFIPKSWNSIPAGIIVVNHFQKWEEVGYSANDNFIGDQLQHWTPQSYFRFMSNVFPLHINPLNATKAYFLTGGQYDLVNVQRPRSTFSNLLLAKDVESMSLNVLVDAPEAGHFYSWNGIRWLREVDSEFVIKCDAPSGDVRKPFSITQQISANREDSDDTDLKITQWLAYLKQILLFSSCGHRLIFTDSYINGALGPRRFCVQLVNGSQSCQYVFDFSKSEFEYEEFTDQLALIQYPSGFKIHTHDLVAAINGKATIAEIAHAGIFQWYVGTPIDSVIGMLYTAFAEFMPNGIAAKKYDTYL